MKSLCFAIAVVQLLLIAQQSIADEPELITIQSERLSVAINPIGAELWSVASLDPDQEFLWHGDPEFWEDRAPIMFPVNVRFKDHKFSHDGKTYDMPLLGIVKDAKFKVLPSNSKDSVELALESNDETLKHYPFSFRFGAKYQIRDRSLTVTYSVRNNGDETMYFAIGGHPGLATPTAEGRTKGDYELHFSESLTLDRTLIQDGLQQEKKLPYLRNESTLNLKDARVPDSGMFIKNCQARQIGVGLAGRPPYAVIDLGTFPNVNIWTPQRMPFACIEPMAAHHDLQESPMEISQKSYLLTLDAGQENDFQYSIHVHPENWTSLGD